MHVKDYHGKQVIDSREVAEMVEKNHKDLLRDIRRYIKIMEKSTERNFAPSGAELKIQPSDFFIPSTYQDSTGRELPCYLITKKGCDMIANKLTGEKGVLFTAAYVTAFEEMKLALDTPRRPPRGLSRRPGEAHQRNPACDAGHGQNAGRGRRDDDEHFADLVHSGSARILQGNPRPVVPVRGLWGDADAPELTSGPCQGRQQ